ncbi:MAG TPA: ABC transporter permease [Baekduia sp.]|nr:ABC transporter permease [Baekduia sp.]
MSRRRVAGIGAGVTFPAAVVALWWVLSADSTSLYFPPLEQMLDAFKTNWFGSNFADLAVPTLVRAAVGMALAFVLGVGLGALVGLSPRFGAWVRPELEFMRALPPILILPPMLLILGTGDSMKVAVVALSAMWPILLATTDGVRSVEPVRRDMGAVFGLPWSARLRHIVLPTAVPHVWSGVRAATPIAFVVLVASEYYASTNGIGYFISQTSTSFRLADMWSAVLLLGVIGVVVNGAIAIVGHRLDRRFGEHASE